MHACMLSCFSHAQLLVILWTVAPTRPVKGFSRQNTGAVYHAPFSRDLPDQGIKPTTPSAPALEVILYH